MTLSWKKHSVSLSQRFCVICQKGINTHPSERIYHRIHISCIIFNYRNVHFNLQFSIFNQLKMMVLFL